MKNWSIIILSKMNARAVKKEEAKRVSFTPWKIFLVDAFADNL